MDGVRFPTRPRQPILALYLGDDDAEIRSGLEEAARDDAGRLASAARAHSPPTPSVSAIARRILLRWVRARA